MHRRLSAASRAQDAGAAATNASTRLPLVTVTAQKERRRRNPSQSASPPPTQDILADAGIREVKEAAIYSPNTFHERVTARALSNPFFRGIGGSPANPGRDHLHRRRAAV